MAAAATEQTQATCFAVGKIVQVESRTWPGINKPGGVGRITRVHYDANDGKTLISVDVRYTVVGGRERHVPIEHVQAAPEFDVVQNNSRVGEYQAGQHLRDRSGLLGRCKRCGSLRADCGSCDWVEQERISEQATNQSTSTKRGASQRLIKQSGKRKHQAMISLQVEESSSSSSDVRDGADYLRRRQYRKLRPYWEHLMNESASDRETSSSEDESVMNDPLLARLNALTQRRRERKRRLATKYATTKRRSKRRVQKSGLSTLETLPKPKASQPRERTMRRSPGPNDSNGQNVALVAGDVEPSPPHSPPAPAQPKVDVEDVGEPEVSSEEGLSPTPSAPARRDRGESFTSKEDSDAQMDSLAVGTTADDETLYIEDLEFIQPEGEDAAEHLPSDIVDRTESIPFKQLPKFFDDLLHELTYEVLPDSKLALADFQRRTREARDRNDLDGLRRLKEAGEKLFDEIQRNVIRNGVDQCREAMRQMTNRRQRRIFRKKMTKEEWKLFEDAALEARDAQFDVLVPDAEMLLREAGPALLDEFNITNEIEIGNDEASECSEGSVSITSKSHVDEGTSESDPSLNDGEATSLPPFDPHMHASTLRRMMPRSRGDQTRSSVNHSRRKRRKQRDSREGRPSWYRGDASVPVPETQKRSQQRTKRRRGRSRPSDSDGWNSHNSDCHYSLSDDELVATVPRVSRRSRRSESLTGQFRDDIPAHQGSERNLNRKPMVDRMQAFLDANALNLDDGIDDSSSQSSDGPQGATAPRRQNDREHRHGQTRSVSVSTHTRASGERDIVSIAEGLPLELDEESKDTRTALSTDTVFKRMRTAGGRPQARRQSLAIPPVACLSGSCKGLLSTFRSASSDCAATFDAIVFHFKVQSRLIRREAVEVFQVLLQLLRENANMLLQFVSLTAGNSFAKHVRLLVFALELLKNNVHTALTDEDGIVFDLFGAENYTSFVQHVVLQMMDVVYAQIEPSWWGLDSPIPGVIGKLIPLRDAIATLVPLVETVSRCLIEKFGSQRWRQIDGDSEAFVSALDPEDYKSLLLTGRIAQPLSQTSGLARFQLYRKEVPKNEIEALWFLLAFCAEAPVTVGEGSMHRWRLLASLFGNTAGVLSSQYFEPSSKEGKNLPPGEVHLAKCEVEVDRCRVLVSSKALNPLPDSDSFLTKLFQKCLLLVMDEFRYSMDVASQESFSHLDAADCARISRIWKATRLLSNDLTLETLIREFGHPENQSKESGGRQSGRVTGCLPMSTLLESCLSLSVAWGEQVPDKKARRSRLSQSLRKLVLDFVDRAAKLKDSSASGTRAASASTFEEAFADDTSSVGSRNAAITFREAAARLSVIGNICGITGRVLVLTAELRKQVWDIVADSVMKQKQQCIIARKATSSCTYNGDPSELVSVAKSISWLAKLHWLDQEGEAAEISFGTLPQRLVANLDGDENMLVFLASCLSACLDCGCDLIEHECDREVHANEEATSHIESLSSVISCICLWLSQLCLSARFTAQASVSTTSTSVSRLFEASEKLRYSSFGMISSSTKRALVSLLTSPYHCENGDLALLSVLGLVRAVVGLVTSSTGENAAVSEVTAVSAEPPDNDLFGSMDDSLFLNIDLGGNDSTRDSRSSDQRKIEVRDPSSHAFRETWSILVDMINFSKPSERFAILLPRVAGSSTPMSVPGRTKAANNIGEVCVCLAALTTLSKEDFHTVDSSLDMFTRSRLSSLDDTADDTYMRYAAQCFYSEVCSLSTEHEQCDRLVQKRWGNILEHFVDAMLDSNTLERFPSVNLKRIKENCGAGGERRQRLRISEANNTHHSDASAVNDAGARLARGEKADSPGPAYNSSHLWYFSENLGKAMARVGAGERLASLFAHVDSYPTDDNSDSIALISLEKECLQRFRLFRGILSNISRREATGGGVLSFENLSTQIISSICRQLVAISRGVDYQARHGRNESGDNSKSYKHARLLELQACYTELAVSLLSWILRESPTARSTMFDSMLQYVRDQLFSRVLLGKKHDIHICLEQLHSLAMRGVVSCAATGTHTSTLQCHEAGLSNDLFVAVVRRSHEIMLHLALSHHHDGMGNVYCLFNSLIALATNCNEDPSPGDKRNEWAVDLIIQSMNGASRAMTDSYLPLEFTPFQRDLDACMRHVALDGDIDREGANSLQHLRLVAMRQFLTPKLLREDTVVSQKKGVLRFLSALLQVETQRYDVTQHQPLELNEVASIIKGVASFVRAVLESPSVDDEAVSKSFECSRHILALCAGVPDDEMQVETLLSWCRNRKDDCNNAKQWHALYVWTFATWMGRSVGKMLVGGTNEDKITFEAFRSRAVSLKSKGQSIWTDNDEAMDLDILKVSSSLTSLEDRIFEKENTRPVTNMYAKSRPKAQVIVDRGVDSRWTPNSNVRRAVKELQAKVIAVL